MRDTADELKALRNSAPKPSPSVPELRKIVSKMNLQKLFYKNYNRQFSLARSLHPPCYVQFLFTSVPIKSLHEETLFYIFYALHDTDIQIKAYNELIARNYLYSRALEHFVHNCPRVADRKKRSVIVFDHLEWIKVIREVVLDEEFVESLESYVDEKSGAW
ncbi:hypothetical protein PAPHI01_0504 [Pancytospora philotis]|nr:hypothetical protein PAPHI01_0504 [Pancytospora philotis]